jgi:hypothetical protein
MRIVVGVMTSSAAAANATGTLVWAGIPLDQISRVSPGASAEALRAIPTTDAEQPGIGPALGAVVRGTMGVAGGAAVAALVLPGVGPVTVLGVLTPLLLGVGGAIGGAAAGAGLDEALTDGLPKDERYVYEDALRRGRSLVLAVVDDGAQAEAAREVLAREGAESVDAAREHWWLGLRSAEAEAYTSEGGDFERDEQRYRLGFDAPASCGRWIKDMTRSSQCSASATATPWWTRLFEQGTSAGSCTCAPSCTTRRLRTTPRGNRGEGVRRLAAIGCDPP